MAHDREADPVSKIRWVERDALTPNDYNPNKQAPPEHDLLIESIDRSGWTQPIVALPDGTIVDGFHRYAASAAGILVRKYRGLVPVATLDADPVHRKMATIRHNRARGTHGILPMADLVRQMVEDGVPRAEILVGLGTEDEELDRLLSRAGMPVKFGGGFGEAWRPDK